jgi:hypothetical protein
MENVQHLRVAHPVQAYVPKMQSEGQVIDYAADCG